LGGEVACPSTQEARGNERKTRITKTGRCVQGGKNPNVSQLEGPNFEGGGKIQAAGGKMTTVPGKNVCKCKP